MKDEEIQNVTLTIPKALLKRAKIFAAKNDTSLSQLMRTALEDQVRRAEGYEAARIRQKKLLAQGFDLGTGGKIPYSRDDLHER